MKLNELSVEQVLEIAFPPRCQYCGEVTLGAVAALHLNCGVEVDTIHAPAGAELGDYAYFHQRAKDISGQKMAIVPE